MYEFKTQFELNIKDIKFTSLTHNYMVQKTTSNLV